MPARSSVSAPTGTWTTSTQVAARLARQAILDRTGAPQLWCILDEGVLHRAIGGSKVMRSQLYRLAEVAEHPKTTIQVIRSGGAHAGLLAHFVIADLDCKPPVAYLETAAEGQHQRPSRSRPRQQAPRRPPASLHRRHLEDLHPPAEGNRLTRDELLARLVGLRQARLGCATPGSRRRRELVPRSLPLRGMSGSAGGPFRERLEREGGHASLQTICIRHGVRAQPTGR